MFDVEHNAEHLRYTVAYPIAFEQIKLSDGALVTAAHWNNLNKLLVEQGNTLVEVVNALREIVIRSGYLGIYCGEGEAPDWAYIHIIPTQSGSSLAYVVGRSTSPTCEIFNDYNNNRAGTMVFKIVGHNATNKSLTLDSTEGLAVDMECSMSVGNNYDFFGKITDIAGTVVTFDAFPVSSITITDNCVLWVPRHPELGTTGGWGDYSSARGYNNIASRQGSSAEGCGTVAGGEYSHTEGVETLAGFAAHAEGFKTIASNQYTHAGGTNSAASHIGSFVHGQGLTTSANYQAVFGTHNLGNTNALFIIGNGQNENIPTNAFEVHKDGSALVYTQGNEPMSVVQKQYVDNTLKFTAPNIVDGQWYLGEKPTGTPATGESGAPKVRMFEPYVDADGSSYVTSYPDANEEWRSPIPLTDFALWGFNKSDSDSGLSPMWSVMFQTADRISVAIPDNVVWAVAEPVFEPNRTYWLSFVECGDKYLGVWSVV